MSKLCIYHASCTDGFAAALAVYMSDDWGPDTEFLPAHYGDTPPDAAGKDVIIVDFSYPREELEAMNASASSLLVLDHHKTAQTALEGLDYAQFDMSRSGATMAWDYLRPDLTNPELISYIQDRDLWICELPESREVSAALSCHPHDFEFWIQHLLPPSALASLKNEGKAILRYQDQQVERAISDWNENTKYIEILGHRVPLANCTSLISETCGALATGTGHPFAVTYFDTADKRFFSLRVRDGGSDVDVSEIAKAYGGGGHAKAAGFTQPLVDVFSPIE